MTVRRATAAVSALLALLSSPAEAKVPGPQFGKRSQGPFGRRLQGGGSTTDEATMAYGGGSTTNEPTTTHGGATFPCTGPNCGNTITGYSGGYGGGTPAAGTTSTGDCADFRGTYFAADMDLIFTINQEGCNLEVPDAGSGVSKFGDAGGYQMNAGEDSMDGRQVRGFLETELGSGRRFINFSHWKSDWHWHGMAWQGCPIAGWSFVVQRPNSTWWDDASALLRFTFVTDDCQLQVEGGQPGGKPEGIFQAYACDPVQNCDLTTMNLGEHGKLHMNGHLVSWESPGGGTYMPPTLTPCMDNHQYENAVAYSMCVFDVQPSETDCMNVFKGRWEEGKCHLEGHEDCPAASRLESRTCADDMLKFFQHQGWHATELHKEPMYFQQKRDECHKMGIAPHVEYLASMCCADKRSICGKAEAPPQKCIRVPDQKVEALREKGFELQPCHAAVP